MQGVVMAHEAIEAVLTRFAFNTVLDIGSGQGLHAGRFRQAGKTVTALDKGDHWGRADVRCDFFDFDRHARFDLVWASHVLEHQLNVNAFLLKLRRHIAPGGCFAITVPPAKPQIVGGHVTVWNEGLLLYNLVLAGFDCSAVSVKRYGYNISVIGKAVAAQLPDLCSDAGDIERLAQFFPMPVAQGFEGDLARPVNWL
jgi:SAM-dependent methyltransferase